MSGFVWLVGAGPGDPEYLTLRAARVLASAEVVFYDALVAPATLALARRAQRFSVGKRAGGIGVAQAAIHRLLIRAARRGRRVVRLKCGDPFVLGRGGEEALALRAAAIPFAVVPGVSSALAAPGLAGIPVTHRGVASAFLTLSGHSESAYGPLLAGLAPHAATLVVLMAIATRTELAAALLARGWRPETPAAICLAAALPDAWTWIGRLADLGRAQLPADLSGAPGTIVIGDVVALAADSRRDRTEQDSARLQRRSQQ